MIFSVLNVILKKISHLCLSFCSSSRSIKRRKFDDELVESSLNVGGTNNIGPKVTRTRTQSATFPTQGIDKE